MKTVRAAGWFRCWVVMATILSWVVLSNHCALGGMTDRANASGHSCCAKTGQPKGEAPKSGGAVVECCKSMHAQLPDSVSVAQPPVWSDYVPFLEAALIFESQQPAAPKIVRDFPPEHRASFVEEVLQKSLHAHAPPSIY